MATRFGKYLLLHNLSVGGAVEVYLGKQTGMEGFEKLVFLKKLVEQQEQNRDVVEAFLNEARTAARLNHPNIIQVYDLGRVGNSIFIAMECVTGENLRGIARQAQRRGTLVPLPQIANIMSEVLQGLHFAHTRSDATGQLGGVVHRNICPQNVVVTYEGTVKIVDFGIAKAAMSPLTYAGVVKGSLAYMAPEQCRGVPVDGRADVFAVGAILYELCTGRSPFNRDTDFLTIKAVTEEPLVMPRALKPELPEDLERVILKALERDRERRYATAEQMQLDLGEFLRRRQHEIGNVVLARMMKDLFAEKLARAHAEAEAHSAGSAGSSVDENLTVSIVAASAAMNATPSPSHPVGPTGAEAAVLHAIVEYAPSVSASSGRPDPTTGVTKVEKPIEGHEATTDVNRVVTREELAAAGPEASRLDAVPMVSVARDHPVEEDGAETVAMGPGEIAGKREAEEHEPRTSPDLVVVETLPEPKRSVPVLRVARALAPPEVPTVIIERTPAPLAAPPAGQHGIPLRSMLVFGAVALAILACVGLLIGRLF